MDIEAIHQGLANAADAIAGLRCYPHLPDAINPPVFAPTELALDYDDTFDGAVAPLITCGLFVSRADDDAGRAALSGYLAPTGPNSIKAALESDRTLGGTAQSVRVQRARGAYGMYTIGGVPYLGVLFDVEVLA